MEEPQEVEEPVVIQTFDPNSGDYYACWNCRTHIALHQHLLPSQPGMQIDDRAFSEAINVYTNSPAEDHIELQHNCTNVYCITCNQILGIKFIQDAGGYDRPIVGEFIFAGGGPTASQDMADAMAELGYSARDAEGSNLTKLEITTQILETTTHVGTVAHMLPCSHMFSKFHLAFSEAINVYTNSPAEDQISLLHNVTSTNVHCNTCNLILGIKFIQVAEDIERPMVGEVLFDRPRLIRIGVDSDVDSHDDMD